MVHTKTKIGYSKIKPQLKDFLLMFLVVSFIFMSFNLTSVNAFSSKDVIIEPIKDTIQIDEEERFVKFAITILKSGEYVLDLSSFGFDWFVTTEPQDLTFSRFVVEDELQFTLTATLVKQLEPKIYAYVLSIRNVKTDERVDVPLRVLILPSTTENKTYPLVLRIDTGINKYDVLPGEEIKLDVLIENKNPRNVGDVILKIISPMYNLTKKYVVKPRIKEAKISDYKKYEVFTIKIPNQFLPQKVPIDVVVEYENQTYSKHFDINVNEYMNSYSAILPSYVKWLGFPVVKILNISLVNKGNVERAFYHEVKLGFFDKFISTDLNVTNRTIIVNESVMPYSKKSHYIVIDYRPIFISLVILLITILGIIILYYLTRAPIVFHKSLEKYYFKSGYLYLVLNLSIKNRSRKPLKDVVVKEYMPAASEPVIDDLYLSPKTAKTKKGILLKWELKDLEPKDERLLVYKVRFKLRIFGGVKFSPSELYYVKGNKTYKLISNELFVRL